MDILRDLRIKRKISQQVVADYLGITRQAYSNYENGNRTPDTETLLKLAEYFEITVDELLRGTKKAPADPEISERSQLENEIMNLYKHLPPKMQDQAMDYLRYLAEKANKT